MFFLMAGTRRMLFTDSKMRTSMRFTSLAINATQSVSWAVITSISDILLQDGNDYEIFSDPRTIGHSVSNPADTIRLVKELFFS